MIQKQHNNNSKEFFQKLISYLDSVLVNVACASEEDSPKLLTNGMINLRDAIFAEIIRDSFTAQINTLVKSEKKEDQEEKDTSQEGKSELTQLD